MNAINGHDGQGFSDLIPSAREVGGLINAHEVEEGSSGTRRNKVNGPSIGLSEEGLKWSKPFTHLPEEIINEIFLQCASEPIEICGDPPCPAWTLAQVSEHWRIIALSQHNLWSSITVDLDKLSTVQLNMRSDSLLDFVRACLHRSHERPLDLHIKACQRLHPLLFPLTDVCLAHAHRWQTVSFHFSLSPFLGKLERSRGKLSLLKTLSLTHDYRPAFPINAFVASPQLTRLTLCKLHSPTKSLNVPWNQITHFESNVLRYNQGELEQILANMPLLQQFKMICGTLFPLVNDDSSNVDAVALPHLRSFHLSGYEEGLQHILTLLHTPNLEHFALKITERLDFPNLLVLAFLDLLRRSLFTLDSLSLNRLPVQSIVQLLDAMPSITHLFVRSLGVTELLPSYLVLNHDASRPTGAPRDRCPSRYLVPRLRSLVMEDTYIFTDSATLASSAGTLLTMVKSRSSTLNREGDSEGDVTPHQLRSVSVALPGILTVDTPAFDALTAFGEEEGIKIDVDVRRKGSSPYNSTSLRSAN